MRVVLAELRGSSASAWICNRGQPRCKIVCPEADAPFHIHPRARFASASTGRWAASCFAPGHSHLSGAQSSLSTAVAGRALLLFVVKGMLFQCSAPTPETAKQLVLSSFWPTWLPNRDEPDACPNLLHVDKRSLRRCSGNPQLPVAHRLGLGSCAQEIR